MMKIKRNDIVNFLNLNFDSIGFVDRLKIRYRPYVCPLDDLLSMASGYRSVYDIGCGNGQFVLLLAEFTDVFDLKGIEISDRLVNNARYLSEVKLPNKKINFAKFDGFNIPEDITNFDLIYLVDVLHHIPKNLRYGFINNLYNSMRVGSKLIVKDINAGSPLVMFNKIHDLIFSREIGNELSLTSAIMIFEKAGFFVESFRTRRTFVYPHYFLTLTKL